MESTLLSPAELIEKFDRVDHLTGMHALMQVLRVNLTEFYPQMEVSPISNSYNNAIEAYNLTTRVQLLQPIPITEKYWSWTGRKERITGQRTHEEKTLVTAYTQEPSLSVRVNDKRIIDLCEKLSRRVGIKYYIYLCGNLETK